MLEDYSSPVEGSKQLKFATQYPKPMMIQFWAIFAKYTAAYWRMPEYNGTRFLLALGVGFTFGAMFWRLGDKVYVLFLSCEACVKPYYLSSHSCLQQSRVQGL